MRSFCRVFTAIVVTMVAVLGLSYLHVPDAQAEVGGTSVILKGTREGSTYTTGASVFSSDFTFVPRSGWVRVTAAFSSTTNMQIYLIGASTTALTLNTTASMTADYMYSYDVPMRATDRTQAITYNIRFTNTGAIKWLLVEEHSSAD